MTCPTVDLLLLPRAQRDLADAFDRYPHLYDQVLEEVHARLNAAGFATKLDLAALTTWKHVRTAPWRRDLLKQPPMAVQQRTQAAFAPGISDQQRIDALESIPGFGRGSAFTSVLLAAWRPAEYGVYDDKASDVGWVQVVDPQCVCNRRQLPVYFDHLRQMAVELRGGWTPRDVDMALFSLLRASGAVGSRGIIRPAARFRLPRNPAHPYDRMGVPITASGRLRRVTLTRCPQGTPYECPPFGAGHDDGWAGRVLAVTDRHTSRA